MRLTKEDRYGHFYTNKANCRNIWSLDGKKLEGVFFENQTLAIDGSAIDKLGELEDIEEELGIDLITLFKIYKNGFAFKDEKNEIKQLQPEDLLVACLAIQPEYKRIISAGYYWYFKDYGKTWSLTKEELL